MIASSATSTNSNLHWNIQSQLSTSRQLLESELAFTKDNSFEPHPSDPRIEFEFETIGVTMDTCPVKRKVNRTKAGLDFVLNQSTTKIERLCHGRGAVDEGFAKPNGVFSHSFCFGETHGDENPMLSFDKPPQNLKRQETAVSCVSALTVDYESDDFDNDEDDEDDAVGDGEEEERVDKSPSIPRRRVTKIAIDPFFNDMSSIDTSSDGKSKECNTGTRQQTLVSAGQKQRAKSSLIDDDDEEDDDHDTDSIRRQSFEEFQKSHPSLLEFRRSAPCVGMFEKSQILSENFSRSHPHLTLNHMLADLNVSENDKFSSNAGPNTGFDNDDTDVGLAVLNLIQSPPKLPQRQRTLVMPTSLVGKAGNHGVDIGHEDVDDCGNNYSSQQVHQKTSLSTVNDDKKMSLIETSKDTEVLLKPPKLPQRQVTQKLSIDSSLDGMNNDDHNSFRNDASVALAGNNGSNTIQDGQKSLESSKNTASSMIENINGGDDDVSDCLVDSNFSQDGKKFMLDTSVNENINAGETPVILNPPKLTQQYSSQMNPRRSSMKKVGSEDRQAYRNAASVGWLDNFVVDGKKVSLIDDDEDEDDDDDKPSNGCSQPKNGLYKVTEVGSTGLNIVQDPPKLPQRQTTLGTPTTGTLMNQMDGPSLGAYNLNNSFASTMSVEVEPKTSLPSPALFLNEKTDNDELFLKPPKLPQRQTTQKMPIGSSMEKIDIHEHNLFPDYGFAAHAGNEAEDHKEIGKTTKAIAPEDIDELKNGDSYCLLVRPPKLPHRQVTLVVGDNYTSISEAKP